MLLSHLTMEGDVGVTHPVAPTDDERPWFVAIASQTSSCTQTNLKGPSSTIIRLGEVEEREIQDGLRYLNDSEGVFGNFLQLAKEMQ